MLLLYRCLTFLTFPLLILLIYFRVLFKKEDKLRYKEKIYSSYFKVKKNIKKKLIWFHASSIGEVLSILPLINKMGYANKNVEFLITSVTLSSSNLLKKKLVKFNNITHRFFPLDNEILVNSFLNSWKPDLVCFVDSEIWPNFLFKIKEKKIPLVLVNGRVTKKTFKKWKIFPKFAKKVFNNFDLCIASSHESRGNLNKLGVKKLTFIGNLKFSVKNESINISEYNKAILDNFKVWCAASTHKGEELIAIKTHIKIKEKYNNILTIIIPRHINRVSGIKNLSNKFNLNAQILNNKDIINPNTEILIINSFGVLSNYFSYCKNIFIGKSFLKNLEEVGGQNPIEAAKLGCQILHGPYVYNFQDIYNLLNTYGIAEQVSNERELSLKIINNFKNPKKINAEQIDLLNIYGEKILKETTEKLNKFIK